MELQASNSNQTPFHSYFHTTPTHLIPPLLPFNSQPHFPSKPTWHLPSNPFPPIPTVKNARLPLAPLHCGISSNSSNANVTRSFRDWVELVGESVSTAFQIWVALGCLLGLVKPSSFNWVTPNCTILGLTLTMLGMCTTLTFDDLRGCLCPRSCLPAFFFSTRCRL